ncbi:peptidoglycan DD-metalloendopeptidase family protein [Pseudoxanthomonas sp. PXM02]|uniref:peptidoglycan DD-metalloendopeptidase family protein n=1 Tax=Pseudoxanthomonas sp. PXM02 TaxID=2769294 RepID=UPI00177DE882|nr:peptidoglycan DD-metalloendopeptidase family protein [Pseudoxanthomonas sp. PXM02]MBD9478140.1 peptidoglycan DD-metalloendopeptidase family protein [Pseudoxanthomonas sp. PXM02]
MTTTSRPGHRITRALLIGIAIAVLGACSTTVVREPSASSPARQTSSQGKPGATVRVQRGDTLYGIAFRNGVDVNDLARWNSLAAPYTIYPGQSLKLFPGSSGSRPTTATVTKPATGATTRPAPPPAPVTRPAATPAPASSGFSWRWPADGHLIGRFVAGDATKQGVDIAGTGGQAVRAAADGVVVYSGAGLVGYGELIIVKHSEAWLSAYGHNRKRLVNEGQSIKAGQQIAEMGSSGASREMLHFEIRHNGKPVDPLQYLPPR